MTPRDTADLVVAILEPINTKLTALLEAQLLTARQLGRIADVLERATAAPEPTAQTECGHPIDRRVDFGLTDGLEDWQCGICGYRSVEPAVAHV